MDWQREMVDELNKAKPCDRSKILQRIASLHGYTIRHLRRIAREKGFNNGGNKRSDKGKSVLTDDQIEFVAGVINATRRENKGAMMPVENALEFAIDNGIISRGQITVRRMQQILKERQINQECQNAPTPHTNMRSLHPNHVHQVDASVCIQYYLQDGGVRIMREDEFYKNKFENFKKVKEPLLRYILVDHFSAFYFVKYYVAAGETIENLFDFLYCAWQAKEDQRMPFRGAPQLMLMDGGSHSKARGLGKGFWDGLSIEIIQGMPGNSRRQGSVEIHHNIWEQWFETRLKLDSASTVEDLNRKAFGFCLWYNATKTHSRTNMTRLSCWQMIKPEQLREIPSREELQDLMNKPEETRTVNNSRISFQGKEFSLRGLNIPQGVKVTVIKNIWKWKEGVIRISYENNTYELTAIDRLPAELGGFSADAAIIGQEYKAQPETKTQKAVKRMNEIAHGSSQPDKKSTPFMGLNAFEGFADKVGNLATLPKRGTPIELCHPQEPVQLPITQLFKRLKGYMNVDLNQRLRAALGETVSSTLIDELVTQIIETGTFDLNKGECQAVNAVGGK